MKQETNIKFSTSDYALIAISAILLLLTWGNAIAYYSELPETIAVHFNGAGKPDGFGSKNHIWFAPILFTILSGLFILGAKKPNHLNLSDEIVPLSKLKVASKLYIFSSLLLSSLVLLITHSMIITSLNENASTQWMMPVIFGLVIIYLLAIFYYQYKSIEK